MEETNHRDHIHLKPASLSLLAVFVGLFAGLGAVVFRGLIALFHNLFFLGRFSWSYDANLHTAAGPLGPLVILVPVVGALGVAFLVSKFAPEAKGHGVPEVMDAVYYQRGVIRPAVAVIKSLASALSIGSGGAVGREGPIIQIGSCVGSVLAQVLKLSLWQRITLIAAGAGGGIAATFNTPIGGMLFAVEILLHEVSVRTLVPVAVATASATYIGRVVFGPHPSFVIPKLEAPDFHLTHPLILLSFVGLGLLMGVISALFIRSLYGAEDFFEKRIKGGYYVRHALGMLIVGVMMYLSLVLLGHYYIQGVGYATVQDVLSENMTACWLLLLLFSMKLVATSLTLGSGASGGIFSPALFMGATFGGAYGILLNFLMPGLSVGFPAFAVAGMAGVVGGATGAAIAAIVMIFEMTLDYNVIIPMTLTVAISYGVRRSLCPDSIYTLKLSRRGHYMPDALQANFPQLRRVRDVMDPGWLSLPATTTLEEFSRIVPANPNVGWYLVEEQGLVMGVLPRDSALAGLGEESAQKTLGELASRNFVAVREQATLFDVAEQMRAHVASVALVADRTTDVRSTQVRGIISRQQVGEVLAQAAELFGNL